MAGSTEVCGLNQVGCNHDSDDVSISHHDYGHGQMTKFAPVPEANPPGPCIITPRRSMLGSESDLKLPFSHHLPVYRLVLPQTVSLNKMINTLGKAI
jgi:hypothetical protein